MNPTLSELYVALDSAPTRIIDFLQRLADSHRLPQPLRVLDVGCGPGRLLRPLEQLRWEVVGMEPNPDFFAAAGMIAKESRRVEVRRGGFQDIDDLEAFDLVVGVNFSFAHLSHPEERADALRRVYRALRPGGVVFLDLPNFLWYLRHDQEPGPFSSTVHGREVTLHRRHAIDYHEATLITTDRYVFSDGAVEPMELVHAYGITTVPELKFHLANAGLERVQTYNGYDSPAPGRICDARMLLSAQRPAA